MQEVAAKGCEEDGKRVGHFSHRICDLPAHCKLEKHIEDEIVAMIGTFRSSLGNQWRVSSNSLVLRMIASVS